MIPYLRTSPACWRGSAGITCDVQAHSFQAHSILAHRPRRRQTVDARTRRGRTQRTTRDAIALVTHSRTPVPWRGMASNSAHPCRVLASFHGAGQPRSMLKSEKRSRWTRHGQNINLCRRRPTTTITSVCLFYFEALSPLVGSRH